jgi:hypothetical protein
MIKKIKLFALSAFALTAFALTAWATQSPAWAHTTDETEWLLEILARVQDNNPRGTLVRKGVKYKWEMFREGKANRYQVKIHREKDGASNLVYSTTVIVSDKRSSGEGYTVKLFYSVNNDYSWKLEPQSYLAVTFKGNEVVSREVMGKMKEFEDNNHGLSEAELNDKTSPDPNTYKDEEIRYMAAATRYLIYKYTKLMKP